MSRHFTHVQAMSHNAPLISIVIAVRNGAADLERCLDSIFQQTFVDTELVIMDGASQDGTTDILSRHNARIDYWVSEPDSGIYNAWNKALQKTRGQWLLFLGADDALATPTVLEDIAPSLASASPAHRVVYGRVEMVEKTGRPIKSIGAPWHVAKKHITQIMLPHQAVFQHRDLFSEHGGFDEAFRIAGDFDFILRELVGNDALFVDLTVTRMQEGGVSSNSRLSLINIQERFSARRNNHVSDFPYILYRQALGELVLRTARQMAGKRVEQRLRQALKKIKSSAGKRHV